MRPPEPELEFLKDAGLTLSSLLTAGGIETMLEVRIGTPPPGMNAIMHVMIGPKR
jgi:hypothetical protein